MAGLSSAGASGPLAAEGGFLPGPSVCVQVCQVSRSRVWAVLSGVFHQSYGNLTQDDSLLS